MAINLALAVAVLGSLLSVVLCQAPVNQVCLMVPPSVEECYRSYTDKPVSDKTAQVACVQQLLWNYNEPQNSTDDLLAYFRDTFGPPPTVVDYDPSTALPPSGYRKRREYRAMSKGEKKRFHNAMDKLYEEGVLAKFGLLLPQSAVHLNGQSFLPWNRVFLTMFEEALRKVDRHVFLPYLDTTMDDEMDNPVDSDLWKPEYFGTGVGRVVEGLGAGYVTHQGHLERNYGHDGKLFSKQNIRDVLSQCYLKDISTPTAKPKYEFERMHGAAHLWIGADMQYPLTAAFDPLFYLLMAYIDYVFELFRVHQIRYCNVNPALDYPDVEIGSTHHPDSPIKGFDFLKNRDGIQNFWIDNWYQYEQHPGCPDCCPTCKSPKPMYCDTKKNVCVARSRRANYTDKASFYEPHELAALSSPLSPRNRGSPFHNFPGDGRTLSTAYDDAVEARGAKQKKSRRSQVSGRRRQRTRDQLSVDTSSSQATRGVTNDGTTVEGGPVRLLGPIPSESSLLGDGVRAVTRDIVAVERGPVRVLDPISSESSLMRDGVRSGGSIAMRGDARSEPLGGDMIRGDVTVRRDSFVRESPIGSGSFRSDLQRGSRIQQRDPSQQRGVRRRPGRTRLGPIPTESAFIGDSVRRGGSTTMRGDTRTESMRGDIISRDGTVRRDSFMRENPRGIGSFMRDLQRDSRIQQRDPSQRGGARRRPGRTQLGDPFRQRGGSMRSDPIRSSGSVGRQSGDIRFDHGRSSGSFSRQGGAMTPTILHQSDPIGQQTGVMNIDLRRRRGGGFRSHRMQSVGPVRRQGGFTGRRPPLRGTVHRPDVAQTGSSSAMRVMGHRAPPMFGQMDMGRDPYLQSPMMYPPFPF